MGVCYADARQWLDRGDGIESCGYVTMAGSGRWNCFLGTRDTGWCRAVGLIYGSVWHWLERGDGIDSGGLPWGHMTLAGSE